MPERMSINVCRTSSIVSENLSERMTEDMSERMTEDMSEEMSKRYVRRYVRKNVKRYVRRYVRKKVKRYVRKNGKRYSRWTNYSNPGQLYPPRPPNFKVVVFFQGLRRVDKTNQTPQHDISRTHSLTLTFGEGGVFQSFPRGLNILSIYGPGR